MAALQHRDMHVTIGIFVSRFAFQVSSMGCHLPEPLSVVKFAKYDNACNRRPIAPLPRWHHLGEAIGGQSHCAMRSASFGLDGFLQKFEHMSLEVNAR